jgi:hypothetical protein
MWDRPHARMATMIITRTLARHTATTVPNGSPAACLSAPAHGSTGTTEAGAFTGALDSTGVPGSGSGAGSDSGAASRLAERLGLDSAEVRQYAGRLAEVASVAGLQQDEEQWAAGSAAAAASTGVADLAEAAGAGKLRA